MNRHRYRQLTHCGPSGVERLVRRAFQSQAFHHFLPLAQTVQCASSATWSDVPALFVVISYRVKWSAPVPIVRSFVEALNCTDIKIRRENRLDFLPFCSEFGFWVLSATILDFCTSPEHQICLLKSNVSKQADETAELEATVARLTGLLGDFRTLVSALDSKMTELMSNVTQISAKFTQVDSKQTQVDPRVTQVGSGIAQRTRK
jgi:hypothetical protein